MESLKPNYSSRSGQDRLWFMHNFVGVIGTFLVAPINFLDNLLSHRRSQVLSFTSNENFSSTKPILFYVHYSKNDNLQEYEVKSIEKIRNLGIQICLIVNSEDAPAFLNSEVISRYRSGVDMLVVRKNTGYDLAAFRDAYNLYKEQNSETSTTCFFMNNSLIWFPEKIPEYFKAILESKSDIFAGSVSHQYHPHIQTFLFGTRTRMGIENLESWLFKIKNWHFKRSIITFGELKTNNFFQKGISIQAHPGLHSLTVLGLQKIHAAKTYPEDSWPTLKRLTDNRRLSFSGIPINPSHDYWLEMLELGFPGIKLDLVAKNPSNIADYNLVIQKLIEHGHTFEEFATLMLTNKPKLFTLRLRNFFKI